MCYRVNNQCAYRPNVAAMVFLPTESVAGLGRVQEPRQLTPACGDAGYGYSVCLIVQMQATYFSCFSLSFTLLAALSRLLESVVSVLSINARVKANTRSVFESIVLIELDIR